MASRYPNKRRNCLTAGFVRHAGPGKYYDADGLYLRVDGSGAARWAWRGTVHGKRVDLGLGSTRFLTLSGARQQAFEYRKLARSGGDPRALRPAQAVPTFAEAAETVIGIHEPGWKDGGKTAAQWRSSLRDYAMNQLGKRRVSEIDTVDVMAVLLPIWTTKAATARKVRQRIGAVMRWSVAQGYRSDNPAGDAIGAALPKANGIKRHYRALPHSEVSGAIATIRATRAHWATIAAIEFLTLTAARSGEVRHARWPEVGIESATWTVPAERAKTGREHRVPLSRRALQVLVEARRATGGTGLIFPSVTGRAEGAARSHCKRAGIAAFGVRETVRTRMPEFANLDEVSVCECSPNHQGASDRPSDRSAGETHCGRGCGFAPSRTSSSHGSDFLNATCASSRSTGSPVVTASLDST